MCSRVVSIHVIHVSTSGQWTYPDLLTACACKLEGCGLMMHRPIGAHCHRPLVTVDVFELLRVIYRKSAVVIFQHLYCPY